MCTYRLAGLFVILQNNFIIDITKWPSIVTMRTRGRVYQNLLLDFATRVLYIKICRVILLLMLCISLYIKNFCHIAMYIFV